MKNTTVTRVEIRNDLALSLIIFFTINEKSAMPRRNMKNTGTIFVISYSLTLSLYGTKMKNIPTRKGVKKRIFENFI